MTARRTGAVSAAVLSGLALTLVLARAVAPEWATRAGLDVWNLGELRADARATADERAALEDRRHRLQQEAVWTGAFAARLIDGSLTLAEAADQLAPILLERPGFDTVWEVDYRAPDFRRGCARYAITKVQSVLENEPELRAAVVARLEAEYAALK
jgi:hypothetical protein